MKKVLLAVTLCLAFASLARASVEVDVGDRLTYGGQTAASYSNGGEFKWTLTKNLNYPAQNDSGFQAGATSTLYSFCAEVNQYIGTPVYVTKLTNESSGSTVSTPRKLTDKAAWLFYRYANGGNAAVPTHDTLNSTSAGAIQWTIWDEMGYSKPWTNPGTALYNSWFNDTVGAYWTDVAWQSKANPFETYVQVAWLSTNYGHVPNPANNWTAGAGSSQDQLILASAGGLSEVPEPTSLAIWSLVATGAAMALRRRRQNGRSRWSDENRQAIHSIVRTHRQA